jgi:hypothetical protein
MIVPNEFNHGGERLVTVGNKDFSHLLKKHGYERIALEPKFGDPILQKYALNPTCYHLFELR